MSVYLDALANAVHLTLELMSDVPAASLGQHVHQGKPGDKLLADDQHGRQLSPAETFRRRYDGCHTDRSRELVITDGLAEVKAIRYSRKPNVDCQTLEGRLIVGRDKRPAAIVAHAYSYTVRHVYNLRREAELYDARAAKLRRAA